LIYVFYLLYLFSLPKGKVTTALVNAVVTHSYNMINEANNALV